MRRTDTRGVKKSIVGTIQKQNSFFAYTTYRGEKLRKVTTDINIAKKRVDMLKGKDLLVRYNKGRNKISYFKGRIRSYSVTERNLRAPF